MTAEPLPTPPPNPLAPPPATPPLLWRLFIALPLPEEHLAALGDLLSRLEKASRFTACRPVWVRPESIHLTLAFLGNRRAEEADRLGEIVRRAAAGVRPLQIEVKGLGVFPDWRHPKVLWTGVRERTHQLEPLRARLAAALHAAGVGVDDKPFKPHLTLARFKSLKGTAAVEKICAAHREFFAPARPLAQVVLFRSTLEPAGARHAPLATVALEPAPPPSASPAPEPAP